MMPSCPRWLSAWPAVLELALWYELPDYAVIWPELLPRLYIFLRKSHQSLTMPGQVKPNDMKTNQIIFIPGVGVFVLAR